MFRYLPALILVAAVAASTNKSVDARDVHPIVTPDPEAVASGPSPADDDGRRQLIGILPVKGELVALCQQMHYKTLCTTMTTLPGVTTPYQLLDASLRITGVKAAMAQVKLGVAMKLGNAQANPMKSCLETCKESYASLVDSCNTARDTIKNGGSNSDLMTELSAAATYATDCEASFEEWPDLTSPIPGAQRHISRLVTNCLDLASTIKEQP